MRGLTTPTGFPFLAAFFWVVTMGVALATRPPLPVDETRYLAVAWSMWRDGEFLVPHLNGATYSHKPPLLFWLMHLGWGVFGVNDWWPRLVAPLFALANIFLAVGLGRKIWPDAPDRARIAALILYGCAFWTVFSTVTMFDMMVALFTLAGLAGMLHAWRGRPVSGFAAFAIAIGFGVLAKGPAILLHLLPVTLLAPWWGARLEGGPPSGSWKRWYLGTFIAVLGGAAIALAWAVPAGIAGGEAYRDAIFWGQSAGRMVKSFAHGRPWWWYLAVIGPLILPWIIWPRLWRSLPCLLPGLADGGVRFCLAWFLPVFIAFSLISGKQLHYLLPIFPALAYLMAFVLERTEDRRRDLWPALIAWAVLGAAVLAMPLVEPITGGAIRIPAWLDRLETGWGLLPLATGIGLLALRPGGNGRLVALAALPPVLAVTVHLAAGPVLDARFDLRPLANRLAQWADEGYTIANYGKYHGQFQFLGRLKVPTDIIGDGEIGGWLERNPKGKIITYHDEVPEGWSPDYVQRYRRKLITVWDSDDARKDPAVVRRPE